MQEIYLDNAATMPILKEVLAEITETYQADYANPSSLHSKGYEVEKKMTKSREHLAKILGVSASEIFFTSGGTESNNLAILGIARANRQKGSHLLTTAIEHPSVLEAVRHLEKEGFVIEILPVDPAGRVVIEELLSKIRPETILVSVMAVNNETGVMQDIEAIAQRVKAVRCDIIFHSDCVQAFGKVRMPMLKNVDSISLGAHKIGGPKGIGLFYLKKGIKIEALLFGGKHQSGLRPGTENYPAVRAFELAAELAIAGQQQHFIKAEQIRQLFLNELSAQGVDYRLNAPLELSSPFIINIGLPDIRAEVLLHALETEGIYISTGSACQSKKNRISHVIEAIRAEYPEGSIRLSLGYQTSEVEVRQTAVLMAEKIKQLRRFVRK